MIIHAGTGAVTDAGDIGVSAETPLANPELPFPVTHPAYPMRCHVEDGLALSPADGIITTCHDAAITPSTIIPPHSGERLDLHLAIWICFANAKNQAAGLAGGRRRGRWTALGVSNSNS